MGEAGTRVAPGLPAEGDLLPVAEGDRLRPGTGADGAPVLLLTLSGPIPALALGRAQTAFDLSRAAGPDVAPPPRDLVKTPAGPCLILEDIGLAPLSGRIPPGGMRPEALLPAMLSLAQAVERLHAAGIIHRDLRPARLLLSADCTSARLLCLDRATRRRGLTGTSAVRLGAPLPHASPELSGRIDVAVDERTDLYSLGSTFHEMACGAPPFAATAPAELAYSIASVPPPDLADLRPDLPAMPVRIIRRLMQKDPDDRYASARDLARDLGTCLDQFRHSGTIRDFDLTLGGLSPVFKVSDRLQGRKAEQAQLMAAVEAGLLKGRRSTVLVSGPSGIGKSAFVDQLRWQLAGSGAMLHAGKFDKFRTSQPYVAFIEIARSLVRPILGLGDAELARHRDGLRAALGPAARLITDQLPELSALLGPLPPVDETVPADAARRFNELVGRFTRYFATPRSPVVLFLDDIQWADHASVALIEAMAEMASLTHVMLILGYRPDEVLPGDPVHRALAQIRAGSSLVTEIQLGPLAEADTAALVAASLGGLGTPERALAKRIHSVSAGNPLLAREYLNSLHERGALRLDLSVDRWVLTSDTDAAGEVPSSVAVFVAARLTQLPEATLSLLDTASCVGSNFDLDTLARVHGTSPAATAQTLTPAIATAIIEPVGPEHDVIIALGATAEGQATDHVLPNAAYRFRHDQIRETVHDRLDDARRAQRHLQIGRLLRQSLDAAALRARAIEVFSHMTWGASQLDDPAERLACAELGLVASKNARAALAFGTARSQLDLADRLLPDDAWGSHYALKLDIALSRADCAFALYEREELDALAGDILRHVTDPLQMALIRGIQLRFLHTLGRYDEATDLGVAVLRDLGVRMPRRPSLARVAAALVRLMVAQGRRKPTEFATLPEATDRRVQAAGRLLLQTSYPAYFSEPNLMPLIGIASTLLSFRKGVTQSSSHGMSVLALVLCGVTGQIDRGYDYGQLALTYARRFGGVEESLTTFVVDAFIRHYKDPLLEVAQRLYEGWMRNRDGGDQENATYCAGVAQYTDFLAGRSVDYDLRHPELVDYLVSVNMPHVKDCFLAWDSLFQALRQPDLPPDLTGPLFDYPGQIEQFTADRNAVQIAISSIAAGILDFLAGRHDRAEARFDLAARYEDRILAQVLVPGLAFFRALNAYRLAGIQPDMADILRRRADRLTRRVAQWAHHSPGEMGHRHALLLAEQHLARGDAGKALLGLHRAAEQAGPGAPFYACLAHLRRASILGGLGHPTEAQTAAQSAAREAQALGATALVSRAEDLSGGTTGTGGPETALQTPDFAALHGFVRFLGRLGSGADRRAMPRLVLDWLLNEANADGGLVVLADDGGTLQVAARTADTGPDLPADIDTLAPDTRQLVDLCLRTDQAQITQVAPEATRSAPGVRLCVPIQVHDRTVGAVYLENRVNRRAFGARTAELVQAVANQMGLALDNDRLLRIEQAALDSQRRQTEANRRFVPEELMRALGVASITEVGLNRAAESVMTVVFADLRGFTGTAQALGPARTIQMINRYLDHVQPGIAAHGGFVANYFGDGLLALFPNAPDEALEGVLAMARGMAGYNRARGDLPELAFRVGVHTGPVTLGMIGDRDHWQCTVLGDAVNTAARLEGLNARFGSQILVSGECHQALSRPDRFAFRALGQELLRGRTAPTQLFEFLEPRDETQRQAAARTAPRFARGLEHFQARRYAEARAEFTACQDEAGSDPVVAHFAEQCRLRAGGDGGSAGASALN